MVTFHKSCETDSWACCCMEWSALYKAQLSAQLWQHRKQQSAPSQLLANNAPPPDTSQQNIQLVQQLAHDCVRVISSHARRALVTSRFRLARDSVAQPRSSMYVIVCVGGDYGGTSKVPPRWPEKVASLSRLLQCRRPRERNKRKCAQRVCATSELRSMCKSLDNVT